MLLSVTEETIKLNIVTMFDNTDYLSIWRILPLEEA